MKQQRFFLLKNSILIFSVFSLSLFISSCGCKRDKKEYTREIKENKFDSISKIKVSITRYEQDLFAIPIDSLKEGLAAMQSKYNFFYSKEDLENPANIASMKQYLNDYTIKSLYNEAMKQYPSLTWLEADLTAMFQKIKYLIPSWTVPQVYTYISGGDIEYPIKYADNNLVIALDLFLGQNYPLYKMWNIPQYITNRMTPQHIVLRCATEIAQAYLERQEIMPKTLLDKMIWHGKLLYFTDLVVPEAEDSTRIGYTTQQLAWMEINEGNVWGFFIEKNLLHSSNSRDIGKFLGEAPFTSTFSKNSAPRTGQYIGWQIVRAYMAKNKSVTPEELLKLNKSQEILNKSSYKPKKNE